MVTQPLRRVRRTTHDIPLTFGIRDALARLADLPPSLALPYLTVCLDWTPAGGDPGRDEAPVVRRSQWRARRDEAGAQRRPGRTVMENELSRLIAEAGPRGEALDTLTAAAERIGAYLDTELDPAAQGVYIVANAAHGVFEPLALGLPIDTAVHLGPTPVLTPLAKKVDDHPAYIVLLADQQEATLALIRRARHGRSVWLEATDFPRRTQRGALNQARYQRRVDERVNAFARHVADETLLALQEEAVDMLIVAGNEVMTSALAGEFHHTVQEAIVDTIRLDITASEQEILDATLPIVARAERERELAKVERIANAVAAGGRGVAGAEGVLRALHAGQASGIALVDDFDATGWADYEMDLYGVGSVPARHPAGGDAGHLVPVALGDEMVRLAVQTSARIEIVKTAVDEVGPDGETRSEAARRLDAMGGVGATLRYMHGTT
jgi:peptide subunit release factor 1 (eRF1)